MLLKSNISELIGMTNKHSILYAEDDLDDLFMVQQVFERHDHIQVVHSPNGQEALNILEEMMKTNSKPCLVILDINMPVLNGKETLIKIKTNEKLKNIPIVLFTTSTNESEKQFANEWNVEIFTKPIVYQDLAEIAKLFVDKCNFEINKLKIS